MRGPPWAVVLSTHQECIPVDGTLNNIGGLPISYQCAGSGFLLGTATRGRVWTQTYVSSLTAKTTKRVRLLSAWW